MGSDKAVISIPGHTEHAQLVSLPMIRGLGIGEGKVWHPTLAGGILPYHPFTYGPSLLDFFSPDPSALKDLPE